jgi:hypothetical protein
VAGDIVKADLAQPQQLCLDIEQLIRWILVDYTEPRDRSGFSHWRLRALLCAFH